MNKKLAIFFLTHFIYGMIFSMFGPIIPYLAQTSGRLESDFTFIFVFRGIAYLVAGFCQQSFLKQYSLIGRMMTSCIVSGICFALFQHLYEHRTLASIICLIMFLANGSMEVLINVLLTSASSRDAKQAISFSYGFYGFGGVMGSIIVSILGLNALTFGAILTTIIGILYIDLLESKNITKQEINEPMINTQQIMHSEQKEVTYLSPQIEKMFCVLFCIYAAISLSYRSWLPSFIVMENFASKQVAAISVSIYSAVLTIFRFVFMLWNPDIIKSLIYSSQVLILTLILAIISFFLGIQIVLIFGTSIILGIIFSSYVPYVYALPSQFNLSFTETGTCNTIISYAIGEAVISALIGCMMDWIHPIMLFVMMFFFSLLNRFFIFKTIEELQNNQQAKKQIELF